MYVPFLLNLAMRPRLTRSRRACGGENQGTNLSTDSGDILGSEFDPSSNKPKMSGRLGDIVQRIDATVSPLLQSLFLCLLVIRGSVSIVSDV